MPLPRAMILFMHDSRGHEEENLQLIGTRRLFLPISGMRGGSRQNQQHIYFLLDTRKITPNASAMANSTQHAYRELSPQKNDITILTLQPSLYERGCDNMQLLLELMMRRLMIYFVCKAFVLGTVASRHRAASRVLYFRQLLLSIGRQETFASNPDSVLATATACQEESRIST